MKLTKCPRMDFCRLLLFVFCVAFVTAAQSGPIVVHVKGGESLVAVRDRVRTLPEDVRRNRGVEIVLPPGRRHVPATVHLDGRDSGVTWRGANDGSTVLSGAREIPWSAFSPVSDESVIDRLDPAVRGKVIVCDVSQFMSVVPEMKAEIRMPLPIPELFLDGRRLPIAVWPNGAEKWAEIDWKSVVDTGTIKNDGTFAAHAKASAAEQSRGGKFRYSGDRPSRWTKSGGVMLWGYWAFDWWESVIPVDIIDVAEKTIALKFPHIYGVRKVETPRRWKAVNLLEEIDVPGEYAVDIKNRQLYLLPPGKAGRLSIAVRDGVFFACSNTSDVAFRDIAFEESFGAGIWIDGCRNMRLEGLSFRNLRRNAVGMRNVTDSVVRKCDVEETGCGGISVSGGDRKTLSHGRNLVEDCLVRNFSVYQRNYASGISVSGVGNTARHCEISGAPHMAVGLGGNDNVIEYCVISNVVKSAKDAGAIYKGRNPSCRGNVIRWCRFADIGGLNSDNGHGTGAIYFDDGDIGETIYGCVFERCGDKGKYNFGTVFSHGGYSNVVDNCIFVECPRALGSSPWSDERWRGYVEGPLWQKRLLKEVDITKPPYTTRYPDFVGFMDPQPGQRRDNLAVRTAFVGCGEVLRGRWVTNETDVVFAKGTDIGEIARTIPGFKPIPADQIGLLTPRNGSRRLAATIANTKGEEK